ncbi:MAG: hypothetical protein GMKNLPBB_02395 [Myxococcota bacterium]|nr:hypothetical protein [Myxococcota bacterium]
MRQLLPPLFSFLAVAACVAETPPGSDLPNPAPREVLGPVAAVERPDGQASEGANITGSFVITGEIVNPTDPQAPIPAKFLGLMTQSGEISSGSATVDAELRDPSQPSASGPRFAQPAAVSASGAFKGSAIGLKIPKSFSAMLAGDADADITLDAQILTSNCFRGLIGLALKEARITGLDGPISIELQGTFGAVREGTRCDFSAADAGAGDGAAATPAGDASP